MTLLQGQSHLRARMRRKVDKEQGILLRCPHCKIFDDAFDIIERFKEITISVLQEITLFIYYSLRYLVLHLPCLRDVI